MLICDHCGDSFDSYKCSKCRGRKRIIAACQECHNELEHGEIGPPIEPRPGLPDIATGSDIRYHGEGHHA